MDDLRDVRIARAQGVRPFRAPAVEHLATPPPEGGDHARPAVLALADVVGQVIAQGVEGGLHLLDRSAQRDVPAPAVFLAALGARQAQDSHQIPSSDRSSVRKASKAAMWEPARIEA